MIDMSNPIGPTPLDRPGGLLGRPLDRVDGPFKVTGRATYAYEYRDFGQRLTALSSCPRSARAGSLQSTPPRPKRRRGYYWF